MKSLWLLLSSLLTSSLWADPKLTIDTDHADAIYKSGDEITFTIKATQNDKPITDCRFRYTLERENRHQPQSDTLNADANGTAVLKIKTDAPEYLRLTVNALDTANQPLKTHVIYKNKSCKVDLKTIAGAIVDPEKFSMTSTEPADFDAFWNKVKAEVKAAPMQVLSQRSIDVPPEYRSTAQAFDIKISCPAPRPVTGILTLPRNAKPHSLPAVLTLHGSGVFTASGEAKRAMAWNAMIFDLNVLGIDNYQAVKYYTELDRGELKDYLFRVAEPLSGNCFKYINMRLIRALEYLKSRPEWDGKNLIVTGASQGGALAITAAALDPDITLCVAVVPWLTGFVAHPEGRILSEDLPRIFELSKQSGLTEQQALDNLRYFENAFFAKRIKAKCVLTYGMCDTCCPPSGVMITYNNLPGDKTIYPFPKGNHGGTSANNAEGLYIQKHRLP